MIKILIVHDSALRRGEIRDLLLKSEIGECWESNGGIEAVEKYRMLQPKLVIINILDMMGVEIVKRIMAINPNVKILVLGSSGYESYVGEAIQSGATNYIIEPINAEDILSTVKKLFCKPEVKNLVLGTSGS
ncbi:MAG: response regulator [bacterium]|nr:response regulator [bacterium]